MAQRHCLLLSFTGQVHWSGALLRCPTQVPSLLRCLTEVPNSGAPLRPYSGALLRCATQVPYSDEIRIATALKRMHAASTCCAVLHICAVLCCAMASKDITINLLCITINLPASYCTTPSPFCAATVHHYEPSVQLLYITINLPCSYCTSPSKFSVQLLHITINPSMQLLHITINLPCSYCTSPSTFHAATAHHHQPSMQLLHITINLSCSYCMVKQVCELLTEEGILGHCQEGGKVGAGSCVSQQDLIHL
jgi:hypothetical protein